MTRTLRLLVTVLAVLALAAAGCGDDDDAIDDVAAEEELPAEVELPAEEDPEPADPSTGSEEAAEPDPPTPASVAGIEVSGVAFDSGTVFVINSGDSTISMAGLWLCNRPNYARLPPIDLAPNEGVQVDLANLDPAGGEVGIFVSESFDRSDDLVSYVEWGTGGGRSGVAAEAELWSGPPAEVTGPGLFLIGEPGSAVGWE